MSVITKNEAKDLRKLWKEDDEENIEAVKEASFWSSCQDLRKLFCVLLLSHSIQSPQNVWNATWKILSQYILCNQRKSRENPSKLTFLTIKIIIIYYDWNLNSMFLFFQI